MIVHNLYKDIKTTNIHTLYYDNTVKKSSDVFNIPSDALTDCNGVYILDSQGVYIIVNT